VIDKSWKTDEEMKREGGFVSLYRFSKVAAFEGLRKVFGRFLDFWKPYESPIPQRVFILSINITFKTSFFIYKNP
jgi:hypothetical protein